MKPPPKTLRSFASNWAELLYLRDKVTYWLHERGSRQGARRYARRLQTVFAQTCEDDNDAIIAEECRALLAEFAQAWEQAASHRAREIQLCQRLHELSEAETRDVQDYVRRGRGRDYIAKLFLIRADDLRKGGKDREAKEAMRKYLEFCEAHNIAPKMPLTD